jgi:hypothetical protein
LFGSPVVGQQPILNLQDGISVLSYTVLSHHKQKIKLIAILTTSSFVR